MSVERVPFDKVFERKASTVYRIADDWADRVTELIPKNCAVAQSVNIPVSETTVIAAADGGIVVQDGPGPEDHPAVQEQLEQWIAEQEAAGIQWDEDDFDPKVPEELDEINGAFVIGAQLVSVIAGELSLTNLPDGLAHPMEGPAVFNHTSVTHDPTQQAELLLECALAAIHGHWEWPPRARR